MPVDVVLELAPGASVSMLEFSGNNSIANGGLGGKSYDSLSSSFSILWYFIAGLSSVSSRLVLRFGVNNFDHEDCELDESD